MPDDPAPRRPTIDERLEAINQTLELVAAMQLDNEKRLEGLTQTVELLAAVVAENTAAIKQDAENIRALARIAEIHEHRLTHLEGEQQ